MAINKLGVNGVNGWTLNIYQGNPGTTSFGENCLCLGLVDANKNLGFTFVLDFSNSRFGYITGPGNYRCDMTSI